MGRPTSFREETAALICERIVMGETVRSICRDPDMPGLSTVYLWIGKHPAFMEQFARAMSSRADTHVEDMIEIADSLGDAPTSEQINAAKLRIDTRKWISERMAPKKYGARTKAEVSGPDGGPIETAEVSNRDLAKALVGILAGKDADPSGDDA